MTARPPGSSSTTGRGLVSCLAPNGLVGSLVAQPPGLLQGVAREFTPEMRAFIESLAIRMAREHHALDPDYR